MKWVTRRSDIGPQVNQQCYFNLFERGFSLFTFNLRNVKVKHKDLDLVLGGGLMSLQRFSKWRIYRFPMVINWVYTHLFIGSQYFSNNQIWYKNHGSWNFKKSRNFSKFYQMFLVNSFMKIVCSLKLLNNNKNRWFFDSDFFSKNGNWRFLESKIFKELELAFFFKFKELPNINPYNVYKQLF
jgi:hypothetical protein